MQLKARQLPSKIVAVVGALAAGKDVLANYLLQRHSVVVVEVGEFARQLVEEADKADAPHYDVSAQKMAEHGPEYVITCLVEEMSQNEEWPTAPLVITGVRTPAEVIALKEQFGSNLLLAYIRVGDQAARFNRVQQRDLTTDPDDFQEFIQQDESLKVDFSLNNTAELADVVLWNNGSLDEFYDQIEAEIVPHILNQTGDGAQGCTGCRRKAGAQTARKVEGALEAAR
jgi:dephospho-CoA kinase